MRKNLIGQAPRWLNWLLPWDKAKAHVFILPEPRLNHRQEGKDGQLRCASSVQCKSLPIYFGVNSLRIFNTALQIVLFCVFIIYSVRQLLHWPTHFSRTTNCSSSILLLHLLAKVLRGKKNSEHFSRQWIKRESRGELRGKSRGKLHNEEKNPHYSITVRTKMSFLIARCEATWCTGRNDGGWGVRKHCPSSSCASGELCDLRHIA